MSPQEINRRLHDCENHACYLASFMRASVGPTVCISRGYLVKVERTLRKMATLRAVIDPDPTTEAAV